jgi:hypothetical protein
MHDYEYDIFLSYRRLGAASDWVKNHFKPVLKSALAPELGRDPEIYFDNRVETGATWPVELGRNLGRSRILICLWSRTFLSSEWCKKELNLMWKREQILGLRTPAHPNGVVAVSIIHDGETMPDELSISQRSEIAEFYNPMMRIDSPKRESFFTKMQSCAAGIAEMIECAPPFDETWEHEAAEEVYEVYLAGQPPRQPTQPRYTQ